MDQKTKSLISNTSVYSIGNILIKLVAFILIPLYARKLLPDEYGIVAILELVELLGKSVLTFGLAQSILRFLTQYKKEKKEHDLIFSVYIFLFIVNTVFLGFLFKFPYTLVNHLLSVTPENVLYFRYILIVIFTGIIQGIFIVILQAEEKAVSFVLFTLLNFILLLGLNIYKVGYLNEGVQGIVESKTYVGLLSFIIVNIYLFKRFNPRFSISILKQCMDYGFPLIFVGISLTLLTLADRYFLKIFRDMSEVGIYSMTYKFGMIMNMVLITPFRQAFFPLMFRLSNEQDTTKLYRKYFTYFLFVGFLFFLGLSMFSIEILSVVTSPKYLGGYQIIPVITFAYLLFGLRIIFVHALATVKKTRIIAYSTFAGALLNIVLNILLIPNYGIMGAAIATLLSYLFITLTTFFPLQKIHPIPWDWSRIIKIVLIGFAVYLSSFLVKTKNFFLAVAFKSFLLLLFPTTLYFIHFFFERELEIIKKTLKKFMNQIK